MSETHCVQETAINHISRTLDRMEKNNEKIVQLLETVAAQTARLEHLEEYSERASTEINTLFDRVRDIELNAAATGPAVRENFTTAINALSRKIDKLNTFFRYTTHKYALIAYGVVFLLIVSGTIIDFMYHYDAVKAIFSFIK
jgi:seryl-tRNA synthetase